MRYAWEQERRKGSGIHAIYARLAEQARKLALIAHEGDCVTEMEANGIVKFIGERYNPFHCVGI